MNEVEVQRDKRLVRRYVKGDKEAFGEIWNKYAAWIRSCVLAWRTDSPDDIIQLVAVRLMEKIHQWRGDKSALTTWIWMVIRSEAFMYLRREKKHFHDPLETWCDFQVAAPHDMVVNAKLIGREVEALVKAQDPCCQAAVTMTCSRDGMFAASRRQRKHTIAALKSKIFRLRQLQCVVDWKEAVNG